MAGRVIRNVCFSVQAEIHFDSDLDGNRLTVFPCRFEFPLAHGFYRLFIQSESQRPLYFHVAHSTIRTNNAPQHHRALVFRFARLFGVIRIWG